MSRKRISTLFERICVAEIPDGLSDEAHERLLEAIRKYASTASEECTEETKNNWTIQVRPETQDAPPEYQKTLLEQSVIFWSSALENGKRDRREWRIMVERKRIVFNYRKHEMPSSGSIAEFISLCCPLLKCCLKSLELNTWPKLTLCYFFIYDDASLSGTEYLQVKSSKNSSVTEAKSQFIDIRKILVPFSSFPALDGFEVFFPPCKYQLQWKQKAAGHEYPCGIRIDTDDSDVDHLRISMPLNVNLLEAAGTPEDFDGMYRILQKNYIKFICETALDTLGGDFR